MVIRVDLRRTTLLLAIAAGLVMPEGTALAQTACVNAPNCRTLGLGGSPAVQVYGANSNDNIFSDVSGAYLTIQTLTSPSPALPIAKYNAWCATPSETDPVGTPVDAITGRFVPNASPVTATVGADTG